MKKIKKEWKLSDLNVDDLELLRKAYAITQDKVFTCFGTHFYKLNALGLIDDENLITYNGRKFVRMMERLN